METRSVGRQMWDEASDKPDDTPEVSSSAAKPGYKEQLLSLLQGLEVENIDEILCQDPEVFKTLGKYMAMQMKGKL